MKKLYLLLLISLLGMPLTAQPPTITSFTPTSGVVGTSVIVLGTNFNTTPANNVVIFGATRATVSTATATSLTVVVPTGAIYAPITVLNTTTGLLAYSQSNFTPTFSPSKGNIIDYDFNAKVDFATGPFPLSVAIGDLDGDGRADLAVANLNNNSVSVFRNTGSSGSISYAAKVDFTTGLGPISVAIGDLDGDGKADLAVVNSSSFTVSVLRNTGSSGTISYAAKVDFTTSQDPQSVAIGDLDGDGKADLTVAHGDTRVSVFRNTSSTGTISYAARVDFETGLGSRSVGIGDLDGDGKADIVVANISEGTVSVLRNTGSSGTISYANKVDLDFTTVAAPHSVAIGDLDGDGKADLAVANFGNTVSVFRNTGSSGTISYAAKVDFTTGLQAYSVAIGDLDGDGKADLAVANNSSTTVSVLRNTGSIGTISYAPRVDFATGSGPRSVAIGDLDGDGKADLAVANYSSNSVSIIRNNPLPPPPIITSFTPTSGVVGTSVTITGTGFNPTATSNVVIFGATRATVSSATATSLTVTVPTGATHAPITVLNTATGLLAYTQSNFTPTFAPSKGSITAADFEPKVDFATGANPYSVSIGDLDGDGKADLAVLNFTGRTISIFRNTSSSSTISYATIVDIDLGGLTSSSVVIGDVDGDGKADLVTTNNSVAYGSVFRNTGSPGIISFAARVNFVTGFGLEGIAIGDLDGDGKVDLAVANSNSASISVLRNIGNVGTISYAPKVDFNTGNGPRSVAIGDFDGDGKADLAVANLNSASVSVFRNTASAGTISYAAKVDFATGLNPYSVSTSDLDSDGKTDLVVAGDFNTVSVLRNTSTGTISFTAKVDFTTGDQPRSVSIGDLDGDGRVDMVVSNSGGTTVSVFRNTGSPGTISYRAKVDFSTGFAPFSVAIGDLDGDGKADLVGANYNSNTVSIIRNDPFPLATAPTAQPTSITFTSVTTSSFTVNYVAATGSPAGYVAVRRAGAAPTSDPEDETTLSLGAALGDGVIAYVGSALTFNESGLAPSTTYHYKIYSYNGNGITLNFNYLQASPLTGSRSTLVSEPASAATVLTFPTFTVNSLGGSFTATTADGYIVLQRWGASPTGTPVDGTTYTVGTTLGDGTVVAVGAASTFSATSLTANTVYFYDVIAYNGLGNIINYNTTSRLEGSRTTLQTEPTAQPTTITFNNNTISSLGSSFTAASGSPAGYLILRKQGSAPTFVPVDGTTYSPGTQGDATVVASGPANTFTDSGLVAGTTYHYSVYSFNGASQAINYLIVAPLTNSVITITASPTATDASVVAQTSFTANWSSVTGAASYSLDVSADNFSNLLSGYAAKSIGGLSDVVTGLTPGTTYQYRVRAVNASGLSANSNTISQITIPQTPTAGTAQEIRSNDFKAVWSASPGATSYELDVSQNNFATFVTGYQSKSIPSSLTEEIVTGLSPSTQYQYRVRSLNSGGVSFNSNATNVSTTSTGGTTPLAVSNTQAPSAITSPGAVLAISTTVIGGSSSKTVKLYYRGILATDFSELNMGNPTGTRFEGNIPANASDEIGIEYYIRAEAGTEVVETNHGFINKTFSASEAAAIPTITSFGGTLESYQIISIPFDLEKKGIADIFEASSLGAYDDTQWRLVRYQNGRNTDFKAGLTSIELGESYWFNSIQSVTVKPGAGSTPQYNQSKPFVLKLAQGWNQIATPYPFAIDWDDVLDANGNPTGIGKYKVYVPASTNFAESNSLQPYSGGFVFVDPNQAKDLMLPVTLKNTSGGRKASAAIGTDIGKEQWLLPITLLQGKAINPLGGIGMHPNARTEKDDYDDITLPRFVKHLEFNSYHNTFIAPRFSKDVVPTTNEYVWNISIESNFSDGDITLDWSGANLGENEAQLLLHDPFNGTLTDMKRVQRYAVKNTARHELEILYLREKKSDLNTTLLLGRPFPNPSSGDVNFNVFSWEPAQALLEVYDLMGKRVHSSSHSLRGKEAQPLLWQSEAGQDRTAAGMYLYKLTTRTANKSNTIQGRILIQ